MHAIEYEVHHIVYKHGSYASKGVVRERGYPQSIRGGVLYTGKDAIRVW